jgi:putative transposase
MRVVQAFRFELDPSREAQIALGKHVGAARFAYNWGLARCLEAKERGKQIPLAVDLHKDWNKWKRENAPWWVEVSKCAPQEAFRDLERAVRNWRKGRANFPRFKRKKALADNKARLTGHIRVTPRHVQLPSHRQGPHQGADGQTPGAPSVREGPHPLGDHLSRGGSLVREPDL